MAIYVRTYDSEQLSVSADTKLSNLNAGDVLAWDPLKNAWVNTAPPVTEEAIKDLIAGTVEAGPGTENIKLTTSYNDVTGKLTIDLTELNGSGGGGLSSISLSNNGAAIGNITSLDFTGANVVLDGTTGRIVIDPVNGVSLLNASIDSNGHLILQLSNNTILDAGAVVGSAGADGAVGPQGPQGEVGPQGPAGADGTSIQLKGSVDTVSELPTNATIGDLYIVSADGLGYAWDGSQWDNVGPIQGPAGPQGEQGLQGVQGVQGLQGEVGPQGPIGLTGPAGPQGEVGLAGPQGPQGATGLAGKSIASTTIDVSGNLILTFSDGSVLNTGNVIGPQGAQGATGATGPQGIQGLQGEVGPKGDTGATGPIGATGLSGPAGTTDYNDLINKPTIPSIDGLATVAYVDQQIASVSSGGSVDLTNYYTKTQVDGLIPTVPTDINQLTDTSGLLDTDLSNYVTSTQLTDALASVSTFSGDYYDLTSRPTVPSTLNDLTNVDTTGVATGQALVFDGAQWVPTTISGTGAVDSVNGQTGTVSLTSTQIAEGSNLYYTDNRVSTVISTTNLNELADVSTSSPTTGQVLKWNGSQWAPAADSTGTGGGTSSGIFQTIAQIEYDASGNLTSVSIINGDMTATITDATSAAAEVQFTFVGASAPPLTTTVYGYQRVSNQYIQRAVDSSFNKRLVAAGGTSGSPTAFSGFDSATHKMTLSLTKTLSGASSGLGQTTHCVVVFTLV
jgi:hypothetical protein